MSSFLWYDYETFGTNPRHDRIAQFGAVRTDLDLNPIGDPLSLFCKPPPDYVPDPGACVVTGLDPQRVAEEGLIEADFAAAVHEAMSEPDTCVLGYNSLRFDDEFSRFLFWRNFFDPYAREYSNGNSRWDLIDMTRLCYAVRPTGIEWPEHEDGKPSFRLEDLCSANGIEHGEAHEALADVYATIALARRIKQAQPGLFDYCLTHRSKAKVQDMLDWQAMKPVAHVSARYPAERGCLAIVAPLALHPQQNNAVIVYDLMIDPSPLAELDAEALRRRVFSRSEDLGDMPRLPLKLVRSNKSPVLVPVGVVKQADQQRIGLDLDLCQRHLRMLQDMPSLASTARSVFSGPSPFEPEIDPDGMLYDGFVKPSDKQRIDAVRRMTPAQLASEAPRFDDERLPHLLWRYRARNYPHTLSDEETELWQRHCEKRLDAEFPRSRATALEAIEQLRADHPERTSLLDSVEEYLMGL